MDHYRAGHPSRGGELTAAILRRFHGSAKKRGKAAVVLVLPTGLDLSYHGEHGRWPYQPLLDMLAARKTEHHHVGPALLARMKHRELRTFFHQQKLGEHLNAAGNAALAEVVHAHLVKRGLVPAAGR